MANIKFKTIEELKMTRAEEYDYNKFLSDSSDDYPKYDEGYDEDFLLEQLDGNCKNFYIKQADDDMLYQEAYSQDKVRIALENVLTLAGERLEQFQSPDYTDADIVIADESIRAVKDYFFNSGEAVFNNSQIAQDNKD